MNLKPEYQKIIDAALLDGRYNLKDTARLVAIECQALADKPPIGLTDDEILMAFDPNFDTSIVSGSNRILRLRAVIAAHIKKQKSPTTVKLRAAQCGDSLPFTVSEDYKLSPHERWVSDVVEVTLYPGE